MKYVAIIVKTGNGYSAHLPDLPCCIAAADTFAEAEELVRQGAVYYVELMAEDGETIPEPTCTAIEVDVPLPATPEEIAVESGR